MYLSKYFYSASFQNDMVGVYTGNIAMGDPLTIVLDESIETLYVDGLIHADASFEGEGVAYAWNYVKMDDGKWYLVDTTYGDNTSPEEKYLWLHKIGEDNREMYDYIMLPEDFEMGFDDNLSGQH